MTPAQLAFMMASNRATGGGGDATLIHTASSAQTGNGSVSYAGVNVGTASADRIVIVCVMYRQNTISGVTIGGNAANTVVQGSAYNTSIPFWAGIYSYNLTSGTTATIAFTLTGNARWNAISVYSATGISETPAATGTDNFTISPSVSLSGATGGVCVACATSSPVGPAADWSGGDLTEDFDANTPASNDTITSASASNLTAADVDCSCAITNGGIDYTVLTAARFNPS